jgi:hypothetical protein
VLQGAGASSALAALIGAAIIDGELGEEIVIPVNLVRLASGSGSTFFSFGIPLQEGAVTTATVANAKLTDANGSEIQCYMEGLGRAPDGSCVTLLTQFTRTANSASPEAGFLRLNSNPALPRLTKTAVSFTKNSLAPTTAGFPAGVVVPTSVDYLVSCRLLGGYTKKQADMMALGGKFDTYEKRLVDFWEWQYSKVTGGVYGTAPGFVPGNAYIDCRTDNTNWNGVNLVPPVEDPTNDGAWRNAIGAGNLNYYERLKTGVMQWRRTGDVKYLRGGLSIGWHNLSQYFDYNKVDGLGGNVEPYLFQPESCALHYLLTGDELGVQCLEGFSRRMEITNRLTNTGKNGFGDGRTVARLGMAYLMAHLTNKADNYDYAANLTTWTDKMVTGDAWDTDGLYKPEACVDTSGRYNNLFMNTLIMETFARVYDSFSADSRIMPKVQGILDGAYPAHWAILGAATVPSFKNWFNWQCLESNAGPSVDLTNMYTPFWAWYASRAGAPSYKTIADDVLFFNGVGVGVTGQNGPWLQGHKQFNEQFVHGLEYGAFRE